MGNCCASEESTAEIQGQVPPQTPLQVPPQVAPQVPHKAQVQVDLNDDCWYLVFANCTVAEFIRMRKICHRFNKLADPTLGAYKKFWTKRCQLCCGDFEESENKENECNMNHNTSIFHLYKELKQYLDKTKSAKSAKSLSNEKISLLDKINKNLTSDSLIPWNVDNPIIKAIRFDFIEIFKFLMINIKWENYCREINCDYMHDYNINKYDLDRYKIPINLYFPYRPFDCSLIGKACGENANNICKYLLQFDNLDLSNQRDGDINDTNVNLGTPFMSTIWRGNDKLFRLILKHPNFENSMKKCNLDASLCVGTNYMAQTPLQQAICQKNIPIVKLLINDCKVDVDGVIHHCIMPVNLKTLKTKL